METLSFRYDFQQIKSLVAIEFLQFTSAVFPSTFPRNVKGRETGYGYIWKGGIAPKSLKAIQQ